MDLIKGIITYAVPVNQILKFIINNYLSSYLIIKESDITEKEQNVSGLKNVINLNDLELNLPNINQQFFLNSPIKLLNGKLGHFSLDLTKDNKIIITIEDFSLDLIPIFNNSKKYQEIIFNMNIKKEEEEKEQKEEEKNSENEKKKLEKKIGEDKEKEDKANNKNEGQNNSNYMLNMANQLLSDLEINIKNITIKLFTYEISDNIMENPVFSIFIMNINVYKNTNKNTNIKNDKLIDPNTKKLFQDIFVNNLVLDIDKLCVKVDQNLNKKDDKEFKEIKKLCDCSQKLTKKQEEKILSFFIAYNTIFAMNYKKGPCLSIKLNTKPRIEKRNKNEKIVEDMNIEINIFEAESIITPQKIFNIQILTQISTFIFAINKNKQPKNNNNNNNEKKEVSKNEKKEDNKNNNDKKNIDVLGHEISKFRITMNATRIVLVLLENNNNQSIPKLFSFLMEDEIDLIQKNDKKSIGDNKSFENYYCYYDDNVLFVKINDVQSINNENNSTISVSSIIGEYIQPINKTEDKNKKQNNSIFCENEEEDIFQSALEDTEILVMENYHQYIDKYIKGEYKNNKFEIININEIIFNMIGNSLDIKEIILNVNYIIILLFIKLLNQVCYFIDINQIFCTENDIMNEPKEGNLNVNLEKELNDSEMTLLKNLQNKSGKINNIDENDENGKLSIESDEDSDKDENNQKKGMTINLNYISLKIYNVKKDIHRYDTNLYFYNLFLELIYPNIPKKDERNNCDSSTVTIEKQSLTDIISEDFIEIILGNINMIMYKVSKYSKINIILQEIFLKYCKYIVIKYNNINKKNDINNNPNIMVTTPGNEILVDFVDKVRINLEKNILDDFLSFINVFLYGLSMYQIFDQFCSNLFKNKLINLFDKFGLKNHFLLLKNINIEDSNNNQNLNNSNKSSKNRENKIIKKETKNEENSKKEPSISVSGRIVSCVININRNGTFEEREGNLMKIKIVNIGANLEMFSEDNSCTKNIPIYNDVSLSINNIYILIKEHEVPKEGKAKYFNIISKNQSVEFDNMDYFSMKFKFRNVKKIKENIIIEEENENDDDLSSNEKSSQKSLTKKGNKFDLNKSKIKLNKKITDYIEFLLNNQVKLDNMEMIVDVTLSEIVINSFYHKLNMLSSTLSDFYIEFTNQKTESNLEGVYILPSDLIPLCEERLMIIKLDFKINHLLVDIFLKEDKEQKNWMRMLLLLDKFNFIFNETGLYLTLDKIYIYIMKDFNYIYHIKNDDNNYYGCDIGDKINDIHKEDSQLKRLGYTELFYEDKINLEKTEKKLNLNLGNINVFMCRDTLTYIFDFVQVFTDNYLDKIKNIFTKDTLDSEASNEIIEEKDTINNSNQKSIKEEDKKEREKECENKKDIIKKELEKKKEKDETNVINDFEVVDDPYFFMDDKKYKKDNKKEIKSNEEEIKKKSKDSFVDDFTNIESKESLMQQNLRIEREQNCDKYILGLNSFRLYLFSGLDFNFEDDKKNDLDLSDKENKENIKLMKQLNIKNNYLHKYEKQLKKKSIIINKRKKNEARDYNNYILLNIINLSLTIVDFCYFDFYLSNFFIDDNFEKSQFRKLISKQDYSRDSTFLSCKIEINKEKNKNKDSSFLNLYLTLSSLDILVDQYTLTFIVNFFLSNKKEEKKDNELENKIEKKRENNNKGEKDEKIITNSEIEYESNYENDEDKKIGEAKEKECWDDYDIIEEEEEPLYVNKLLINTFDINIHYNSHKISFKKLFSLEDYFEFLNVMSDIKELKIKFKSFRKNIKTPLSDIINELINFWKDDILKNQITNSVLKGLSITRPFYKIFNGVKDLIVQPYRSFRRNEGIKKGLKKGMKNFFVSVTSQGLFFGEKIFRGLKIVVFGKTKLSLKKKSMYKRVINSIIKKQYEYETHYFK